MKGKKGFQKGHPKFGKPRKGFHSKTEFKKGFKHSEEFKKWLSEINTGEKHPQFGLHRSESTKQKLREKSIKNNSRFWLGKHRSEETKNKLRIARVKQVMITKETSIEKILYSELERRNIPFEKQKRLLGITIVDAFVEPNICIYADGEYWHSIPSTKIRDMKINQKLEENGYKVYRFNGKELENDSRVIAKNIEFKNTLGVPKSDSDVINSQPKVLLIGAGWVGQTMLSYFSDADIYTSRGFMRHEFDHYDLAIIGVPTPMDQLTGQGDTSIVEEMVNYFKDQVDYFLIKSTVEIGTTDRIKERYGVKIAMSPEYVGETLGHPLLEPHRDAFQIIGGEDQTAEAIAGFWRKVLNANAPIMICNAVEAEIIKYCENYWITQRVDYWNDVFEICKTLGGNFSRVREGICLDPRMPRTHSNVYPDNRGWSGKCLPKDMNALAFKMRKAGNPLEGLEYLIDKNAEKWRKEYKNRERLRPAQPRWR